MVAFVPEPQRMPMLFFMNLDTSGGEILGDCTACGAKHVSIFEHVCALRPKKKQNRLLRYFVVLVLFGGALTVLRLML